MDLSTSHFIQLIIALLLGIGLFLVAFLAEERKVIGLLVLLIPFQPITSRYGSLNEVLAYMVFAVYLMQGRMNLFPLLGSVALIFFAYALSFTQAPRAGYLDNIIYLSAIGANFILFYIVYNFLMREQDWRFIWKLLIVLNVLIAGYCFLQAVGGASRLQLFGIGELSLNLSRTDELTATSRLTGPFKATAMTSEAIVILIMITAYALIFEHRKWMKVLLTALIGIDSAFLIATGNRGGIISLAIGAILFLYFYRRELGAYRAATIGIVGVLVFVATSVIMVRYTMFNVLYERLEATEFHGVVPDSREGWFDMWPRLIEKPIVGHGPRMKLEGEDERRIPGHVPFPYPHSMYLYLLYTVGFVGLLAYMLLFTRIGWRYFRSRRLVSDDKFLNGVPRLGIIIIAVFAISEFRMEMFRYILRDYQQFLFVMLAVLLALTDILRRRVAAQRAQTRAEVK